MADSFARTLTSLRAEVARYGASSFAGRRWFAGKGRSVLGVEVVDAAPVAGSKGILAVAEVRYADGAERYLVPFVPGRADTFVEPEPSAPFWVDLAEAVLGGRELAGVAGSFVASVGPGAGAPTGPGRALSDDQSNTSVVLGEQLVLKCYRRLEQGLHPEPEALAALARVGSEVSAPWRATLTHRDDDGEAAVALLYGFVPGAPLGWEPIIEGVCATLRGGSPTGLLDDASLLGSTTASLHRSLAEAFGTLRADDALARRLHAAAHERLDAAGLDAGARAVAAKRLDGVLRIGGSPIGRVHGDLHVAQFVRSADRLVVVDFEGEPHVPLAGRRALDSPLRDVASLLLSLDHAAVAAARRVDLPDALERAFGWSDAAREHALDAYRRGVAGTELVVDVALLRALEVEKECRELLYAARVLPEWLYAPQTTFPRLLGRP